MSSTTSRPLKVFLCHSSSDKPAVRKLYKQLGNENWIDPWLDEEKLLPGQDWEYEIERALDNSDAVIVFLSTGSVSKEGFVQRELRFALDIALEKPKGTIYILPIRLDDCERPRKLRSIQSVDYFPAEFHKRAYSRLLNSLELRARALGIVAEIAESENVPEQSTDERPKPQPVPEVPSPSLGLYGRIRMLMKLGTWSGWNPTTDLVTLDGKTIPIAEKSTSFTSKQIVIFNEIIPIGEHEILISWGGSKPGKVSRKFLVGNGIKVLIIFSEKVNFWGSYSTWEISIEYD